MDLAAETHRDPSGRTLVEGIARVISLDGGQALLEPEVSSGCKGCVSAGLCGALGGTNTLTARRFLIDNDHGLQVGERIVVGVAETTLLRASWVAYAIPLLFMLVASVSADLSYGKDAVTALCAVGGLGLGMSVARFCAGRMAKRGELSPRFLRYAGPSDTCRSE